MQTIAIIASIITVISFAFNIIQFKEYHSLLKRLRSFAQGTFMDHFMIARSCARIRKSEKSEEDKSALIDNFWRELQYINGIADAARNNIISVSEEQLNFTPSFRHPAFPEQKEYSEEIRLSTTPEEAVSKQGKLD